MSSQDKKNEDAVRRYRSWEVIEHLGNVVRMFRDIFQPQGRPSLDKMREFVLLLRRTIWLMEGDEKHIQEMLNTLKTRRLEKEHGEDL